MDKVLTIYEAKTNLSKYIKQAKKGVPIYIGSYGEKEVALISIDRISQPHKGLELAAFLRERFREGGGLTSIKDPSAWQREIRKDRKLPGRD